MKTFYTVCKGLGDMWLVFYISHIVDIHPTDWFMFPSIITFIILFFLGTLKIYEIYCTK